MMSGRKRTSSNVPFTSGKPESKKHRPHSTNGHYSQGILSNKERNSLPSTQPIVEDDMDDDLPATQQSCVSELEQSLWSAPNKNDVTKAVPLDKDQIDRLQTESQEKDLTKSQSETVLKSEIAERDEDIHRLNAEICVLYEKLTQNSAQLMSHEEQIQRLSLSRDDVHRELEHKETQLHRLDSDLSIAKEERRKADDVLSRREITIQQMENDLDMVKQQYREAVEENGRLKARIQAFAINAQSEQDVLSSEVKRSEDGIKRLKMIKVNLQESNSKYAKKNTITLPPGVQIPPGTVLMRNEQGQLVFVPALQSPSQPTSTPGQRIQYVRNTITLPPGVQIPPGTVLMRNEQTGQLEIVFVPALQSPSQPTSTPGQRIQYVRPPSSQPQRPPVSKIVTIQPQQPQVARVVRPNTQPVATSAGPPTTSSQAPGQGHAQQPLGNVKKCKNFLSTLIKLASSQPEQTVKNVRELIQGLIDNKVEIEQFTERLQKELKSSPQPYLVPFLRKSLPLLRQSLLENKMHIEGVKPPPIEVMKGTPFIPSAPGVQQHIRLPQKKMLVIHNLWCVGMHRWGAKQLAVGAGYKLKREEEDPNTVAVYDSDLKKAYLKHESAFAVTKIMEMNLSNFWVLKPKDDPIVKRKGVGPQQRCTIACKTSLPLEQAASKLSELGLVYEIKEFNKK